MKGNLFITAQMKAILNLSMNYEVAHKRSKEIIRNQWVRKSNKMKSSIRVCNKPKPISVYFTTCKISFFDNTSITWHHIKK